MNDIDLLNALKTRLEAVTPPTGYVLHRVWAVPPNSLPTVPAIVISPSGSDSITYGSVNRTTVLPLTVTVYLQDQANDLGRRFIDAVTWRTWLRDAILGQTQLGTAYVAMASVVSTTIGTADWADQGYVTASCQVEITVLEGVNISA